eukprot:7377295-Prymnesium_polylepis.1
MRRHGGSPAVGGKYFPRAAAPATSPAHTRPCHSAQWMTAAAASAAAAAIARARAAGSADCPARTVACCIRCIRACISTEVGG